MGGRAPLEESRQSRRIVTRFGIELDQKVSELARTQGLTRSQLLREAVNDYLAKAAEAGTAAS